MSLKRIKEIKSEIKKLNDEIIECYCIRKNGHKGKHYALVDSIVGTDEKTDEYIIKEVRVYWDQET
jgi:hypothetical protein